MARSEEPLLARRPSSDLSGDRGAAEEDALLTGQKTTNNTTPTIWQSWRERIYLVWAIVATLSVIVLAVVFQQQKNHSNNPLVTNFSLPTGKRNLIFMVSDGMGPTSLSLTRSFLQQSEGLPYYETLELDKYIVGQSRTRSASSLITDSAAGATAFSCARKSYNGAISVLPDFTPCGTVLEAAKQAGYMTGLVVTTRITDATPACFASHVHMRREEDRIAEQLLGDYPLGRTVDLMLGAGRCHFLPNSSTGSCRDDDRDLVGYAKNKGWNYISTRKEFDGLRSGSNVEFPLLGLFADGNIPYELDREKQDDVYPSLEEMAETALRALSAATKDSDKGFFIMIEGSRIDHAGHANDPAAQVNEIVAYDKAWQTVLDFLDKDDTEGIVVGTSDHETGGLAAARQLEPYVYPQYHWFPSVLINASHSAAWVTADYQRHLKASGPAADSKDGGEESDSELTRRDATAYLHAALPEYLGIGDATDTEIDDLVARPDHAAYLLADMISRRSQTGWSTHGHSAADVNIYTSDRAVAAGYLTGSRENTEVGAFLSRYLGVDSLIPQITKKLVKEMNSEVYGEWMGRMPVEGENLEGGSHMETYDGEFKIKKRNAKRGEESCADRH